MAGYIAWGPQRPWCLKTVGLYTDNKKREVVVSWYICFSHFFFFFKCKAPLKLNIHVGSKSVSFFTGQLNGYSKIQTGCYDKDLNNTKDDTGIKGLET